MNINEYFDGNVKSIGFTNSEGRVTSGVMAAGNYEFGTSEHELMKVVSGTMEVKLPGSDAFKAISAGQQFEVDANKTFQVRVGEPTAYLCFYS
ncbi:protein containing DUF1255 [Rhodopirellula sp. SWK7]|nr:pyrimidine/purine nucleoside phosphorylase [Rhodopirellula sp. SWK7]EMI46312.1 protein containing DUF1255 [Rhodopirellula sp. SWK7]